MWRVPYRDPAGREHAKDFPTRAKADAFAAVVEAEKLRGEYHDPTLGRETLAEFCERRWLPMAPLRLRVSTLALMEASGAPTFARCPASRQRRLNSLTPHDIRSMVESIQMSARSLYPAETSLRLVRAILKAAVADGLLARSVAADVARPSGHPATAATCRTRRSRRWCERCPIAGTRSC